MFKYSRVVALGGLVAALPSAHGWAVDKGSKPAVGDLGRVGDVYLKTSCASAAQKDIARATALLHSFFYDEARRVFGEAATKDPGCAMAQWGIAMTWWHPVWTPPKPEEMDTGRAAIEKAKAIGGKTDLERGFIEALAAFYATPAAAASAGPVGQSCHGLTGGADHAARALAHEKAMEKLLAAHPDDVEVGTLYALALLATVPPTDKTLKNQTRATQLLEPLYKRYPTHPGIIHYLIHAYDYPQVAERGLPAAKAYAEIAPRVPHVLHMPSHIFTRLGMWPQVVQSNLASADAAHEYFSVSHPDATSFDELHALDYLVYAYLQTGDDRLAKGVVDKVHAVRRTYPEVDFAVAYATGAVPARYALERKQWADAASLNEQPSPSWEKYPFGAAHVAFARALGAARAGRLGEARSAAARLEQLAAGMTDPRQQYFAKQTEMQVRVVHGWLAAAEGRVEEAEKLLREAADADDALGKHPVSPGSLLPAREILADFLAERGRLGDALAQYEACLKLNPGRFNSLYGAGRAAEQANQPDVAGKYYTQVTSMVASDASRPEIAHARAFLAKRASATR